MSTTHFLSRIWLVVALAGAASADENPLSARDGVLAWFRADQGIEENAEHRVSVWRNQVAGESLAALGAENRPLLVDNAIRGFPAVRFDSDATYLRLSAGVDVNGGSLFAVLKSERSKVDTKYIVGSDIDTNGIFSTDVKSLVFGGQTEHFEQNGLRISRTGYRADRRPRYYVPKTAADRFAVYSLRRLNTANGKLQYLAFNGRNVHGGAWRGEVAELVVCSRNASEATQRGIASYLGRKYFGWPSPTPVPVANDDAASVAAAAAAAMARGESLAVADALPDHTILKEGACASPLASGWYRLHLDAAFRTQEPARSLLMTLGTDKVYLRPAQFTASAFTHFSLDFAVSHEDHLSIPTLRLSALSAAATADQVSPAPEGTAAVRLAPRTGVPAGKNVVAWRGLWLERLSPMRVTNVRTDRLRYGPRGTGVLAATIRNDGEPGEAVATAELISRLDRARLIHTSQPFTLKAGEEKELSIPFSLDGEEWGVCARVTVVCGGRRHSGEDYFSVNENPFAVGFGAEWESASRSADYLGATRLLGRDKEREGTPESATGGAEKQRYRSVPGRARKLHANLVLLSAWSPGDIASLTPDAELWWSGSASIPQNRKNLAELVAALHALGIAAIAEVDVSATGPKAMELAKAHPEAFRSVTPANAPVAALASWHEPEWRRQNPLHPGTWSARMDFANAWAVSHAVEQLRASRELFGWDGYLLGDTHGAALASPEMAALSAALAAVAPPLRLGAAPGLGALAGRGGMLQVGRLPGARADQAGLTWEGFRQECADQVAAAGQSGAFCYADLGLDYAPPMEAYYRLVYALIAGVHPLPYNRNLTLGCPDWGAFMTRFSWMLWNPAITVAGNECGRFTMRGAAVRYAPYLKKFSDGGTTYLVQHLVTGGEGEMVTTAAAPRPGRLDVSFRPARGTVRSATLIDPMQPGFGGPLTVTTRQAESQVGIPQVWSRWVTVVWELAGL